MDPEGADLAASRAFPALVARGTRWLAGRGPFPAELAAGRAVDGALDLRDGEGRPLAAGFGAPVPPSSGALASSQGSQPIALLSALTAGGVAAHASAEEPDLETGGRDGVASLLLLVLALLGFEWFLVRTGRMP